MSGIMLSTEEMKHFDITKDRVLSRRKSMIENEPRLFVILCSVIEAEEIAKKHNLTLASWGRYNSGGKRALERGNKGTVLGPIGGFRQVPG